MHHDLLKAAKIKKVKDWCKDEYIGENRTGSRNKPTHIQLLDLQKEAPLNFSGETNLFSKWCWVSWISTWKK